MRLGGEVNILSFPFSVLQAWYYVFHRMQSIQNLGLALINMAAGAIVDAKGYLFLEVFFCAWLCRKFA